MFDVDLWQEIFSTIKKNKLRTLLTGFSIAWGIFMLMVLLGAGNGLSNGVASNFDGSATNAMWIWNRETSLPYHGYKAGRRIQFTIEDIDAIKAIGQIDKISAQYWTGDRVYSFNNEYGSYQTQACHPCYIDIEKFTITQGRFLNDIDMEHDRKVIVIGEDIRKALFKGVDPVGQFVKIGSIPFKVIGVYNEKDAREGTQQGLIPITTAQRLFNMGKKIHNIALTTFDVSKKESQQIEADIKNLLAQRHQYDPKDERAIGLYNSLENYIQTMNIFKAIEIFIWLIGIGTLIAGIVGVEHGHLQRNAVGEPDRVARHDLVDPRDHCKGRAIHLLRSLAIRLCGGFCTINQFACTGHDCCTRLTGLVGSDFLVQRQAIREHGDEVVQQSSHAFSPAWRPGTA